MHQVANTGQDSEDNSDTTKTQTTTFACHRLTDMSIAILIKEMRKLKGSLLQARWNLVASHNNKSIELPLDKEKM